jgi:hypothetical protein
MQHMLHVHNQKNPMSILTQNNEIVNPFNTPISKDILLEREQSEYEEFLDFAQRYKILIDEETNLYIIEREKANEGMYELFGTTKEEINRTLRVNKFWEIKNRELKREREEKKKAYENRFNVPSWKTKKDLEEVKKQVANEITRLDREWIDGGRESIFLELEIEGYEEKLKKIKALLKTSINKDFNSDLLKAKAHPIENIIEFNRAGFASCPFHGPERTPSFKLYKSRNKAHCFGCGKDADAIDVYMVRNNCSINEAIKNLK